jgi:hypothetical protein
MSRSNRSYGDYESLISEGNAVSQSIKNKLETYNNIKQGVESFNLKNETENYVKDGLKAVTDIGTEAGLAGAMKIIQKVFLNKAATKTPAESTAEGAAESTAEGTAEGAVEGGVEGAVEGGVEGLAEAGASAVESGVTGVVESGVTGAVETGLTGLLEGGAEGVAGMTAEVALEAVGVGLDLTGVGAVVGVPLQIAVGALMVAQTGYSIYNSIHDFEDIFTHGAEKGNQILQSAPKIIADRIAPTLET